MTVPFKTGPVAGANMVAMPTGRTRPMDIRFVTSFAPIVADPARSAAFYGDALGLTFEGGQDDYVFTEKLGGVKHLGLWPLADAAEACFGTREWPADVPVAQASLEFELATADAVGPAADELVGQGYQLLHGARAEPWGQVIARLLSPEGLVTGICYSPSMHQPGG
jgi:catechol 2,3-dioxygenase-like lactoylglutathione lyase family enzyme